MRSEGQRSALPTPASPARATRPPPGAARSRPHARSPCPGRRSPPGARSGATDDDRALRTGGSQTAATAAAPWPPRPTTPPPPEQPATISVDPDPRRHCRAAPRRTAPRRSVLRLFLRLLLPRVVADDRDERQE